MKENTKDYIAQYEGLPEHKDGVKLNIYVATVTFRLSASSIDKEGGMRAIRDCVERWGIKQKAIIELEGVSGVPLELQPKE